MDLVPFLTGRSPTRPHQTLSWKNGCTWAVRDRDLKLVLGEAQGQTAPALFDLAADPRETKDLATNRPGDVRRLHALHDEWRRDFPQPLWAGRSE